MNEPMSRLAKDSAQADLDRNLHGAHRHGGPYPA